MFSGSVQFKTFGRMQLLTKDLLPQFTVLDLWASALIVGSEWVCSDVQVLVHVYKGAISFSALKIVKLS